MHRQPQPRFALSAAPLSGRRSSGKAPIRRRTRATAMAIAAAAVITGAALAPVQAQAARSWSGEIATQSQEALDSLRTWMLSNNDDDLVAYQLLRDRLATTVAGVVGIDDTALRTEWAEVDIINQEIILVAGTQVGVPYRYATSEPGVGFDCSGITLYAYGSAGVDLPRVSYDQIKVGEKVSAEDAEPGDLAQYPGHIMMYLGDGVILHSRQTGSYVEIASLPSRSLRYADVTPDGALSLSQSVPAQEPPLVPLITFVGRR